MRDRILRPLSWLEILRCFRENATVVVAAMNSSRLIDALPRKFEGISHLHARPSDVNPPSPLSDASDRQNVFGREKET